MLYTIDFEYKGGTSLAQVEAADPTEALALWLEQRSDEELKKWKVGRKALLKALSTHEAPVPIEGLTGVWCFARSVGGALALANIIATARRER